MGSRVWGRLVLAGAALLALVALGACGSAAPEGGQRPEPEAGLEAVSLAPGEKLQVVATTNIVGDVARNVGGDEIDLTVLMGIGVDPHTYVPTPADTVAIYDADLVLSSGAGLEAELQRWFDNAGGDAIHVHLSDGLDLRAVAGGNAQDREEGEQVDGHGDVDPHVWLSVPNVIHWTGIIQQTLSALDPGNAGSYAENAQAYTQELEALDAWIQEQVAQIPQGNRKLVTNHPAFGYLAGRYGLEQVGAVYPVNPSSEPSARDIAALEDVIHEYGVPAVFTESTVNPSLAEQVAQDTGAKLVQLYTGSLSGPGSGAETYIQLMRYDVSAIVEALE